VGVDVATPLPPIPASTESSSDASLVSGFASGGALLGGNSTLTGGGDLSGEGGNLFHPVHCSRKPLRTCVLGDLGRMAARATPTHVLPIPVNFAEIHLWTNSRRNVTGLRILINQAFFVSFLLVSSGVDSDTVSF
jgi:hypothetical protein